MCLYHHMGNQLLGVSEAAKVVGVSERTIKRLAKDGVLPHAMKLKGANGAYLFAPEAVEALAAERAA